MAAYFGKVCSLHPELGGKRNSSRRCHGCAADNTARWRKNNPSKAKEYAAGYMPEWREKNKDKIREDVRQRMAAWRSDNSEKVKEKANSPEMKAYRAARRAKERRATPKWADQDQIKKIYEMAEEKSKITGCKWHVDHIVPLQSKRVCGLHCEANLQVLSATENHKKGNRHWPDM